MNKIRVADFEGTYHEIKVGDVVGFKSDVEQCGKVIEIRRGSYRGWTLILRAGSDMGFSGGYIGGQMTTMVDAGDVWTD